MRLALYESISTVSCCAERDGNVLFDGKDRRGLVCNKAEITLGFSVCALEELQIFRLRSFNLSKNVRRPKVARRKFYIPTATTAQAC